MTVGSAALQICFFHRNALHNKLFPELGNLLKSRANAKVFHIASSMPCNDLFDLEYEKEIAKFKQDGQSIDEVIRDLKDNYPKVDFLKYISADREFNFFPKYLGLEKISYERQIHYLANCIKIFEDYLDSRKIDIVITDMIIGVADVFKFVCDKRGVKYLTLRPSKLGRGVIASDALVDMPINLNEVEQNYKENGLPKPLASLAQQHLDQINAANKLPAYMEVTKKKFQFFSLKRLNDFKNNFRKRTSAVTAVSPTQRPNLLVLKWNLRKFYNIIMVKIYGANWFFSEDVDALNYLVFTLQYEPENSTSIRSYPYHNQLDIIRICASCMPIGTYLIVKEHPGNQGYRKWEDYKEISYIPNVRLLKGANRSNNLVVNSKGIITFTSRLGWEALVLGKPVIAFGKSFYTDLKGVYKFQNWQGLKEEIDKMFSAKSRMFVDREDVMLRAACYLSLTYNGNWVMGSKDLLSEENLNDLADIILHNAAK